MRYLCLIHLDEQDLKAMPAAEESALNGRHLDFNDGLRTSGNFIVAEALASPVASSCVRVRDGKTTITDGPYAESKEMIAGFYLLEADTMDEAIKLAAQIPSATFGTVEVRPARQLHVEGRAPRWG
jgi:hypothetical protein